MRVVIQRTKEASVSVEGKVVGKIEKGFMILFGAKIGDTEKEAIYLAKKIAALRVFSDDNGKMNLSLSDIGGEILLISQFTLFADCKKGNRPSFILAEKPQLADKLYEIFNEELLKNGVKKVEKGVFGADMQVNLLNDGPVTIIMDTEEMLNSNNL